MRKFFATGALFGALAFMAAPISVAQAPPIDTTCNGCDPIIIFPPPPGPCLPLICGCTCPAGSRALVVRGKIHKKLTK